MGIWHSRGGLHAPQLRLHGCNAVWRFQRPCEPYHCSQAAALGGAMVCRNP